MLSCLQSLLASRLNVDIVAEAMLAKTYTEVETVNRGSLPIIKPRTMNTIEIRTTIQLVLIHLVEGLGFLPTLLAINESTSRIGKM